MADAGELGEPGVFAVGQAGHAVGERDEVFAVQRRHGVARADAVIKVPDRVGGVGFAGKGVRGEIDVAVAPGEAAKPREQIETERHHGVIGVDRAHRKTRVGKVVARGADRLGAAVGGIGRVVLHDERQNVLAQLTDELLLVRHAVVPEEVAGIAVERRRHDDHVPAHSRGEHIVEHRAGGDVVVGAVSGVKLLLPEPISFAAAHAVQQHEHVVRLRGVVPIGEIDEHPLIIGERAGTLALADVVVRQVFD